MPETENQMGLFESGGAPAAIQSRAGKAAPPAAPKAAPQPPKPRAKKAVPQLEVAEKKVSGLVPAGDVRLTANIRQDLHLRLKISSAHRRTTIGEILEELIEKYI